MTSDKAANCVLYLNGHCVSFSLVLILYSMGYGLSIVDNFICDIESNQPRDITVSEKVTRNILTITQDSLDNKCTTTINLEGCSSVAKFHRMPSFVSNHFLFPFSFSLVSLLYSIGRPVSSTLDFPVRKFQGESLTRILASDVRLCSLFAIVRSGNALNNRTVNDHLPDSTLANLGETADETVDALNLFHFSILFSIVLFYYHYTVYIGVVKGNLQIFPKLFSFDVSG
jgi:hypothetical protein